MTNQPIEEKWKEEFDRRFTYLWQHIDQGGLVSQTTQHEAVKSFIENLLEQEKTANKHVFEEKWKVAEDDIIDKVQDCVYGFNINIDGKEYAQLLGAIKNSVWLRGEIKRVFENLLEQERKRMSDEIEKLKYTEDQGMDSEMESANRAYDKAKSIINK